MWPSFLNFNLKRITVSEEIPGPDAGEQSCVMVVNVPVDPCGAEENETEVLTSGLSSASCYSGF